MGNQRAGLKVWALLAGGLLAACSAQPAGDTGEAAPRGEVAAATHPVSGLELVTVTVTTQGGRHEFVTELAESEEDQARGLMFRTELGPNEAMIFPQEGEVASFWMKNTPLPLDIIFIGEDGRIMNVAAQTTPYSLEDVIADGPTSAVLEIAGGCAAELGIGPGDRVEWPAQQ